VSFKVEWTKESEITFNENIEYLSKSLDLPTINTFLNRVDEAVETLEVNLKLYPVHRKKHKVYKCVLNKHITLYYRIASKSRIDLFSF
jgi:hypothetical protein